MIENVQFPPAATVAPQVLICEKSAALVPVRLMPLMKSVPEPEFVSVTVRAAEGMVTRLIPEIHTEWG